MTAQLEWWMGSNGNLFADCGNARYCIAKLREGGYVIARDGKEIGRIYNIADAKLFVRRHCQQ